MFLEKWQEKVGGCSVRGKNFQGSNINAGIENVMTLEDCVQNCFATKACEAVVYDKNLDKCYPKSKAFAEVDLETGELMVSLNLRCIKG